MFPFSHRTQATAIGGRNSAVASVDGSLKAQLREQDGANGAGTTPEQLLASALAAAFLRDLKVAAAAVGQVLASDANVTVTVCLDDETEVPTFIAHVDVDLPGLDRRAVLALVDKARKACPYARLLPGHFIAQVSVL
jgi:Ohr subfamily peroxiredoxin